ncbi:MAG: acyl-CoA dehydrogenase family protein [Pseudomonadales bacterium]
MTFELQPESAAGERLIHAAQQLVPTFADRASAADASNQVCRANFYDLVASRITSAFVPEDLGGLGLRSIYDWIALITTLARGDASTAIAINMHLGVSRGMVMAYEQAAPGSKGQQSLEPQLRQLVSGEMLICATATETGTDNLHPLTEAVRSADGWNISGRKIFVTLSPIATHLGMNLRMRDETGDHLVSTMVPIQVDGLQPQDDWDALGMRSSGSQSVVFDQVQVPLASIRKIGPWGQWSVPMLMNRALANLPLVGAFLGIAEAAHSLALAQLAKQKRLGAPAHSHAGVQHLVGEIDIELAKCQATLGAAARSMDRFMADHATRKPTIEAAHHLMRDYQAAKWVVNRGAIDIVSKAMDLFGGAGYTNRHPLARLYRDVRAGPFMQPFAPTEARQYVGQVALRQWPEQ